MAHLYPTSAMMTDGTCRDVLIPHLGSLNGRKIWIVLKQASQANGNWSDPIRQAAEFIDGVISSQEYDFSKITLRQRRQIEEALACVSAQFDDNTFLQLTSDRRDTFTSF